MQPNHSLLHLIWRQVKVPTRGLSWAPFMAYILPHHETRRIVAPFFIMEKMNWLKWVRWHAAALCVSLSDKKLGPTSQPGVVLSRLNTGRRPGECNVRSILDLTNRNIPLETPLYFLKEPKTNNTWKSEHPDKITLLITGRRYMGLSSKGYDNSHQWSISRENFVNMHILTVSRLSRGTTFGKMRMDVSHSLAFMYHILHLIRNYYYWLLLLVLTLYHLTSLHPFLYSVHIFLYLP